MKAVRQMTLWQITQGQRLRYAGAILAMGLTNIFIFSPVLVTGSAIDVISKQDFTYATPVLLWLARDLAGDAPYFAYLWIAAFAALLMTAIGGAFLFARGRFAAVASEAIAQTVAQAPAPRGARGRPKLRNITPDRGGDP